MFVPKSGRRLKFQNRTLKAVGISVVGFRQGTAWVKNLLQPWMECCMQDYACLDHAAVPQDMAHHRKTLSESALTMLFFRAAKAKHKDSVIAGNMAKTARLNARLPEKALPRACRFAFQFRPLTSSHSPHSLAPGPSLSRCSATPPHCQSPWPR